MKNLFLVFAAVAVFFSCAPENNPGSTDGQEPVNNNPKELIVTAEASEIEYSSATLSGYANLTDGMTGVSFGIILSKDENLTVDNGKLYKANELDINNKFYCKISNLSIGTKYYYKAYLKEGDYYRTGSKTQSFTTKDFADDLIITAEATEIDCLSAILNGTVNIPSGLTGGTFGFIFSEKEDPTVDNGKVIQCKELDGSNRFSYKATNLSMVKTYYYKAYFKYNGEYRTGKTQSFTTKDFADDLIITAEASEIDYVSAVLNGSVNIPSGLTGGTFGFILSEKEDPTVDNGKIIQCEELDGSNKFTYKASLSMGKTYYYKAYFKYNGEYRTGKAVSFTTKDYAYSTPQAVDLGLSVKWASFNLGASKPEEYGFYYAWGETEPKDDYLWATYKWANGTAISLKKYCSKTSYGYNAYKDWSTVLDPEDDAAHVILGGKWRMPNDAEWTELRKNCTWEWTTMNGIRGCKGTGPNGNSIFLPAAGYRDGPDRGNAGSGGYWSSSLFEDSPDRAWCVSFNSGNVGRGYDQRCSGRSVRPVCN